MSAQAPQLPSVAVQEAQINTGLNSAMMLTFLMGVYTMVYFGSLYLYVTRKATQRVIVAATITMIYLLNMVQLAIQWELLKWSIVNNGQTRETIFMTTFFNPGWATLASETSTFLTNALADGLLIWRCFHVWNGSILAISLPFFLLLAEIGVYLSVIIMASIYKLKPSTKQAILLDDVLSAGYFISLATTVTTTLLIAYRIYSVSHQDSHSKKRFMHILDILVQSAAAYSLVLLVTAIAAVLPANKTSSTKVFGLLNYEASCLLYIISGIAPTIMVARVAVAAEKAAHVVPPTAHLSGLRFQGNSTTHGDSIRMDGTLVIDRSNGLSPESDEKSVA